MIQSAMIRLIHASAELAVLSTILRLGDSRAVATDEWWRVGSLFYVIAIVSFVAWHVLSHYATRARADDTLLEQVLLAFPDVVLLCLLCVYEFCAKPMFKVRLREFGYHDLPLPTDILLNTIPAGALCLTFACLIILCLWVAHAKKSPSLILSIRWTLFAYGLFLLLAIPIVLTMPLV